MKKKAFLSLIGVCVILASVPSTSYAQCTPGYRETQKIAGPISSFSARFAHAVAIDGDVMAIGLPNANAYYQSYVSIYERRDNTWVWTQTLTAPDNVNSSFGFSVAVSGQTIVVGDPVYAFGEGAVWVYEKVGSQWVPDARNPIQPAVRQQKSDFGYAVAMSGNRFLVGAPRYANGIGTGTTFLYTGSSGSWREGQLGPASVDAGDFRYGHAVAMDGDLAVIGAPDDLDGRGNGGAGRVTVWEDTGSWTLTKRLQGSDIVGGDQFGHAVAVQGHTVVAGAPYHAEYYAQGAVYFYERDASQADVYHARGKVFADGYCTGGYTTSFGYALDIDGSDLVIGAPFSGMDGEGEAWLYKEQQGRWVPHQVYHHSSPDRQDNMGYAVATSQGITVSGAPFHGKHRNGAAFVYDQSQLGGGPRLGLLPADAPDEPEKVAQLENYPNPFNPATRIRYRLVAAEQVSLRVYDMTGREVATLVDGVREAGAHEVAFDGTSLASGLYLYRIETPSFRQTKHMLLLK